MAFQHWWCDHVHRSQQLFQWVQQRKQQPKLWGKNPLKCLQYTNKQGHRGATFYFWLMNRMCHKEWFCFRQKKMWIFNFISDFLLFKNCCFLLTDSLNNTRSLNVLFWFMSFIFAEQFSSVLIIKSRKTQKFRQQSKIWLSFEVSLLPRQLLPYYWWGCEGSFVTLTYSCVHVWLYIILFVVKLFSYRGERTAHMETCKVKIPFQI